MGVSGYVLNREKLRPSAGKRYYRRDLELMTTHHLREICRKEKIIHGVINPMDKEELVRVIMRYRGADESLLIQADDDKGWQTLSSVFQKVQKHYNTDYHMEGSSKIVVFDGIAMDYFDNVTLKYDEQFIGTNAVVVSGDSQLCAIFNVRSMGGDNGRLYLTKSKQLRNLEAPIKNYSLYCFDRVYSELLYRIYTGEHTALPDHLEVYRIPLLDFIVRRPIELNIPLAIDFGTANTAAGTYLDSLYIEQMGDLTRDHGLTENDVNYTVFYDSSQGNKESALLPSVVAVLSIEDGIPRYVFGHEAVRLANSSYIDEGFCVFYDIKRWIGDYEKLEEITDRSGRHAMVPRKDIIKAFLEYVIEKSQNRFKCSVSSVHISCPVKQKFLFQNLFAEILPRYNVDNDNMLDEGVAVLYNTISEKIAGREFVPRERQKALIIDCGGGTTDLCSCAFTIDDRRVSYKIDIETTYENGDTNFGGNNLTFRILQLIKLALAGQFAPGLVKPVDEIMRGFDIDVFRYVDSSGVPAIYKELDAEYAKAEALLPTRFRDYEKLSRIDYFKVQNNYYFLFNTAERVKKEFFNRVGTLRVLLSNAMTREGGTTTLLVDKWKLSVMQKGQLSVLKEFPDCYVNIYDIELLLKADIYGIIHKFLDRMYESEALYDYSTIKLSGQSCKIDIFQDAIKEFIPGRVINFKRMSRDITDDFELKMTCVDGALKYLRDKKYGYADITITNKTPALPYVITAFTHNNQEKVLIKSLERTMQNGNISRNMEHLTLKLFLKDTEDVQRYSYTYRCHPSDFASVVYEEIEAKYGPMIPQDDTDIIIDREVKFFVWAEAMKWGFVVVPVTRNGQELLMGKQQFFSFENDAWVKNFFDGIN